MKEIIKTIGDETVPELNKKIWVIRLEVYAETRKMTNILFKCINSKSKIFPVSSRQENRKMLIHVYVT